MNKISNERKIQILAALVEGMSIRSIERMTGTHRDTIMRLMVRIGKGCDQLLDDHMKGFHSNLLQADEIWTFVGKKEKMIKYRDKRSDIGDQFIYVALDAESKLIPVFAVGKRNRATTHHFIKELHYKLRENGRIQLTTDGMYLYNEAVEEAFGMDIDYAQQVKFYASDKTESGRYAPPKVSSVVSTKIQGNPDEKHISTSYVERHNLTMRMNMRRLTRLTNAFSKKLENLKASLALYFAHYNFMRIHSTLRVTPAMQANITDHIWNWNEVLNYECH